MRAAAAILFALLLPAPAAQAYIPNDPGTGGGWQADQWNFLAVDAPRAWDNLIATNRPGGRGATIAVLDTGVARKSPGFARTRFVRGYDYADSDRIPDDENGHGTHIASTIAESTNDGKGLTGLAYGATIMPVKVVAKNGDADEDSVAEGIRFATRRGADVINLSFEFGKRVRSAQQIPKVTRAIRAARQKGIVIVAAAGNREYERIFYPAALPGVISVGAVTEHGCLAQYANVGLGLDLVAPGGGPDAALPEQPDCGQDGRNILQTTFIRNRRAFGISRRYFGTSMATAHVSATAALIIASGLLGPNPTPDQIENRLKQTARDLGAPGPDTFYGAGMLDTGAATAPLTRGA